MFLFPSRLQAQYVYFHNSTKRYCPLTHSDSVPDNHLFSGRENTAGSPTNCGLVYGSQYLTKELIASVVFRPPDLLKASDKNSQRPANQLASPNNALLVCEKKKSGTNYTAPLSIHGKSCSFRCPGGKTSTSVCPLFAPKGKSLQNCRSRLS